MEKMTFEEIQKHNEDARQALIDLYEQRYPCYPEELVVDEVMQNILNYCNREAALGPPRRFWCGTSRDR